MAIKNEMETERKENIQTYRVFISSFIFIEVKKLFRLLIGEEH